MELTWVDKIGGLLVMMALIGSVLSRFVSELVGDIMFCVCLCGIAVMIALFLANVIYKDIAPLGIPRGKEK